MNPNDTLTHYILEKISSEPIARRIILYRCLAIETDNEELTKICRKQADDLEEVENNHEQLLLNFRAQTAAGKTRRGK